MHLNEISDSASAGIESPPAATAFNFYLMNDKTKFALWHSSCYFIDKAAIFKLEYCWHAINLFRIANMRVLVNIFLAELYAHTHTFMDHNSAFPSIQSSTS